MKKILTFLVVSLLAVALFGCSSNEKESNVLTMATEATFEPYEYYDGEEIVGIDVEIAKAIAEKLGKELEVIDIEFDAIVSSVQAGKYDMGMAGLTVTDERKQQVNFSDSYANGVQVIIVKEGSPITSVDDLFVEGNNYVVGVQSGTTAFIYATGDIEDAGLGTVKSFQKNTDTATALVNDQIDCIIIDNEPAKKIVENNAGLKILDTEYSNEEYAIAINKDNIQLYTEVNEALAQLIQDGTVADILAKYIG